MRFIVMLVATSLSIVVAITSWSGISWGDSATPAWRVPLAFVVSAVALIVISLVVTWWSKDD